MEQQCCSLVGPVKPEERNGDQIRVSGFRSTLTSGEARRRTHGL